MKKLLLLTFLALGNCLYAQNLAGTCEEAVSIYDYIGQPFQSTIGDVYANPSSAQNFGCILAPRGVSWFYIPVTENTDLDFQIQQFNSQGGYNDIDYICWGPFTTLENICGSENLNDSTVVSCSYSHSDIERINIADATGGTYYIVMLASVNGVSGTVNITNLSEATTTGAINLNAFLDANANGIQDPGEQDFRYGNFIYTTNNDDSLHTITSFNGNYTIYNEIENDRYTIGYEI